MFSLQGDKIHIFKPPCNFLFKVTLRWNTGIFFCYFFRFNRAYAGLRHTFVVSTKPHFGVTCSLNAKLRLGAGVDLHKRHSKSGKWHHRYLVENIYITSIRCGKYVTGYFLVKHYIIQVNHIFTEYSTVRTV